MAEQEIYVIIFLRGVTIMTFDRVRNEEQRKIRVQEIKDAAIKLFDTEQFHEIDLAKIANGTSFTRGNLYKYISSKEEIFLLVTLDEYSNWINDLKETFQTKLDQDIPVFSRQWAEVIYRHPRFLKLMSMLFTVTERNVSLEKLVEFKTQFLDLTSDLNDTLKVVFPTWGDQTIDKFLHSQFYYVIGFFPYTSPTLIQKQAMEQVGIDSTSLQFVNDFSEFVTYTIGHLHHES